MACGNNKITRSYLSSPPTSVVADLGRIAVNKRRLDEFILPNGGDQKLASSAERKRHEGRHVHVVRYHDNDPTQVLVQVTDKGNREGSRDGRGHHEFVLFLRNPPRHDVDKAVAQMLAALNSRRRGARP